MADYAKDVLVDTQWVQDHLEDDSIRIVEVDENPALYAEAHIPGAIGFDWKADLQDQVKRDFLGPEDFGALLGSRGISSEHTIVLYEAAGTVDPAALEAGAAELALAHTLNEIPGALLEADPRDVDAWVAGARDAIDHLLSVDRGSAGRAP